MSSEAARRVRRDSGGLSELGRRFVAVPGFTAAPLVCLLVEGEQLRGRARSRAGLVRCSANETSCSARALAMPPSASKTSAPVGQAMCWNVSSAIARCKMRVSEAHRLRNFGLDARGRRRAPFGTAARAPGEGSARRARQPRGRGTRALTLPVGRVPRPRLDASAAASVS